MKHVIELSKNAKEMIATSKRFDTVNDRRQIIKIMEDNSVPAYEAVVNFQEIYGGISYRFGIDSNKGYLLDLFNKNGETYNFKYIHQHKGQHLLECMEYHYAGDHGNFINGKGQILSFAMGSFKVISDCMNEFIESEAVKYYFLKKQGKWLTRGFLPEEYYTWFGRIELGLYKIEESSNKYTEWLTNEKEDVFIECSYYQGEAKGGNIYLLNKDVVEMIYGDKTKAVSYFPFIYRNSFYI